MRSITISIRLVLMLIILFLGGCASMEQMQRGINEIDRFWGESNKKIINAYGARLYAANKQDILRSSCAAARNLGFNSTVYANEVKLVAKIPSPFTADEYKKIKEVEEPMMQAIAAKEVGQFTSNFFYLSDKDFNIHGTLQATDHYDNPNVAEGKVLVSINFYLQYIGSTYGIVFGHNPPPEAVRRGLAKYWAALDKELQVSSY